MNDFQMERVTVLGINITLIITVGILAYVVTPWALLGLIAGMSTTNQIVVEDGDTRIAVEYEDEEYVDLHRTIHTAIVEARESESREGT